jgi:integrase/recombinase XerD
MLKELLPNSHNHHRSLPLLGPVLDDFDDWLVAQGYRHFTRQSYILRCTAIEGYFRKRHQRNLSALTPEQLRKCWQFYRHRPGGISGVVGCLRRFLQSQQILPTLPPPPANASSAILDAYRKYLREVRGLAPITIENHCLTSCEFLQHCLDQIGALRFADLTRGHSESFICSVSSRFGRGSLQHIVGHVRGFLRFLAMRGEAPAGLDSQIDMPRVYRLEQLPRALPWNTVRAFLQSIDRAYSSGMRDYAMFLLIATYGLRGCDIAGLKLSDIDWQTGEIHINQSKTKCPLLLPLTDQVAEALLVYLREGRPHSSYREIFLTAQAPILPIQRQTVGYAFRNRAKRSALDIPFLGVHCLRHSYAVRLLRQGVSLKNIGDLLGHRSTESTCVYLRLNVDDLREVALPLPVPFGQGRSS